MRRHPKYARTDPTSPKGWATDMRSGFIVNCEDMIEEGQWAGLKVMKTGTRTISHFMDRPQRQLGTLILSPDPVALQNARPEQYAIDEIWPRLLQRGQPRYLQNSRVSRSMQASVYFTTQTDY